MRAALVPLALAALGAAAAVQDADLQDVVVQDVGPPPVDELELERFLEVPLGLPADAAPPLERARFDLGRRLFFDVVLSVDRSTSCASCHRPEHGFAHPERFPAGAHGRRTARSVPALLNRGFGRAQMWDGRFATLEEQVVEPIRNPDEMALPLDEAVARLAADASYAAAFEHAFEGPVSERSLAAALAAFVGRIFSGGTAVDRFQAGSFGALTPDERGGLWIFESKGRCWRCHAGALFTDEGFHNTGVGAREGEPEDGRFAVTGDPADRGRFKTPTLRGLAATAPYMHDGSLATLADVVAFYRDGGRPNANLDPQMEPLALTDREAELLLAFLRALSPPG